MTEVGLQPSPQPRRMLDVAFLIESSEPRRAVPRVYLLLGGFLGVMVLSAIFQTWSGSQLATGLSGLLLVALAFWLPAQSRRMMRVLKEEQQLVVGIGERLQLKQWTDAATQIDGYLSRPAKNQTLRVQALVFLCVILTRYQRYEDAIAVYDYLLGAAHMDDQSTYTLKLGRAMAVLHDERLVDADRAISELRKMTPSGADPAALGLLELYRDVKTGHSQEAIDRFEKLQSAFQRSLAHRVSDAWVLVARAYDLLGRTADAQRAFRNATLLAPPMELFRRYPETKRLEGRYEPAYAPPEAA